MEIVPRVRNITAKMEALQTAARTEKTMRRKANRKRFK
jgi:hypothetical protein